MEKPPSHPARFTPLDQGKAIGSATSPKDSTTSSVPSQAERGETPDQIEELLKALDTLYKYSCDRGCLDPERHRFDRPNQARTVINVWLTEQVAALQQEIATLRPHAEQHKTLCLAELGGDAVWPCGCHIQIVDSHGTTTLLSGEGHEPCDHHQALLDQLATLRAERASYENAQCITCGRDLDTEHGATLTAAPAPVPSVAVGGDFMNRSLADFERACLVHLQEEQERPNPNNALIAVLCDAVRLTREQVAPVPSGTIKAAFVAGWDAQRKRRDELGHAGEVVYAWRDYVAAFALSAAPPRVIATPPSQIDQSNSQDADLPMGNDE
jgi:hypothetical protein